MKKLIVIEALFLSGITLAQEETMSLTLEQAIEIAQENSPKRKQHAILTARLIGLIAFIRRTICRP